MSMDRCEDCDALIDTDYPDRGMYGKRGKRDILLCDSCQDDLTDAEVAEFYVEWPDLSHEILEGRK